MKKVLLSTISFVLLCAAALVPAAGFAQSPAAAAEPGYIEPEKEYGEGEEGYSPAVPPEQEHIYEDDRSAVALYAAQAWDKRIVRVLLSQKDHNASTVRIYGNYALYGADGEALFIAGDEAAYIIKAENSALSIYSEYGTLLYSGQNASFKEFAAEAGADNNCIKVSAVSMGNDVTDRTYRGDLNIYYFAKSGSYSGYWAGLYLINEVYIEDYIEGVVAAEMGTSFEAAAQQAQAIVSRAFAIQSHSSSRVFDVRDTSASQAYFGITENCRSAVQATAGQTLFYNGSNLRVHFGGTNGGETEITNNQWSGNEFCGEESVREDSYDLVSKKKYVEEVTIPAAPDGSEQYVASLITNALMPALESAGYTLGSATVKGISMETVCNDPSCRHHHRSAEAGQVCNHFCSLVVTFSGISTDAGQYIESFSVTLNENDFYISPNNGRPLGFFSVGSCSRYWLISNYENGQLVSYTIRHARYGGGVGMSQYGANYRAYVGQSVEEILAFYYPNSSVAPLAADLSRPALSVKPQTEYDARILGSASNVYSRPNNASASVGSIAAGETVFVQSITGDWAYVSCGSVAGYVPLAVFTRTAVQVTPANISSSISVRTLPDSRSSSVYTAKKGVVLEILQANAAPGWHKVKTANGAGYIPARYSSLIFQGSAAETQNKYTVSLPLESGFDGSMILLDGVMLEAQTQNGCVVAFCDSCEHSIAQLFSADGGMMVWRLSFDEASGEYTVIEIPELKNALEYCGAAIRLSGDNGLRVRFGLNAAAHDSGSIAGCTIKEYGVLCGTADNNEKLPAFYEQGGIKYDKISAVEGGLLLFEAKREGLNKAELKQEYVFRPYIILNDAEGDITIYGAQVSISAYSVAQKLAAQGLYAENTPQGQYIAALLAAASGN